MRDLEVTGLHELADLIFAVGRQLRPPTDPSFEPCTPIEISVMRYIHQHPGTSARAAAEAALLPSSNFSRVLRGLENRDLVARVADSSNARGVCLYPTEKAHQNLQYLRDSWDRTLRGIIDDPATIETVNATLRHIEHELIARRRSADSQGPRSG